MIVEAIVSAVCGLLTTLFGLIPSSAQIGLPDLSQFGTAIADARIWQWMGWANWYLPVDLAVAILAARVTVWVALNAFDLTLWVLTKLHVAGGGA